MVTHNKINVMTLSLWAQEMLWNFNWLSSKIMWFLKIKNQNIKAYNLDYYGNYLKVRTELNTFVWLSFPGQVKMEIFFVLSDSLAIQHPVLSPNTSL